MKEKAVFLSEGGAGSSQLPNGFLPPHCRRHNLNTRAGVIPHADAKQSNASAKIITVKVEKTPFIDNTSIDSVLYSTQTYLQVVKRSRKAASA